MSVSFNPAGSSIQHDGGMTSESWHISERIDRGADEVYGYASNPANLPRWAPGLGNSVAEVDGRAVIAGHPGARPRKAGRFAPCAPVCWCRGGCLGDRGSPGADIATFDPQSRNSPVVVAGLFCLWR